MSKSNKICFYFNQATPDMLGSPFKEGEKEIGKIIKIDKDLVTVAIDDEEAYQKAKKTISQNQVFSMGYYNET